VVIVSERINLNLSVCRAIWADYAAWWPGTLSHTSCVYRCV